MVNEYSPDVVSFGKYRGSVNFRARHILNAPSPIEVILFQGASTVVKPEQPSKHYAPIDVNVDGKFTYCNVVHLAKGPM